MKRLAFATSAAFLAVGAAALVPRLAPNGMLAGFLAMDTEHAMLFIATGLLGLAFAAAGEASARTFFRLIGIVYAILALMGVFATPEGELMGMAINPAGDVLHAAIAAWALYLGYFRGARIVPRQGFDGA